MLRTELGRKIDVTFQQVQKYENGTNRVGSGRLFKIASTFGVPITAFFEGTHETVSGDARPSPVAMLAEPYASIAAGVFCRREPGPTALASRARRALGQSSRSRAARLKHSARRERGPTSDRAHARRGPVHRLPTSPSCQSCYPATAGNDLRQRGIVGANARPNWREMQASGLWQPGPPSPHKRAREPRLTLSGGPWNQSPPYLRRSPARRHAILARPA